ncbi:PIG-L deacetylase family protein [Variovorax boronicumulans]|uniref:PIG-L deacetylase family protein n=1 Tax=Variovorax boronicumulans TaxID=436515 RepID=UPI00339423D7
MNAADVETETGRAIRGEGTTEAEWHSWSGLAKLPVIAPQDLVPEGARAVVVAPHPDDEILSVGGLLAHLADRGRQVEVIAVTDGTASHRGSTEWPAERLARIRPRESNKALRCLGLSVEPTRLGLPDGGLKELRAVLALKLAALLRASDVVFTTWRKDGHPDHEATGEACALAAVSAGARLVEVPVWGWHWSHPGDARMPWQRAFRLPLSDDAVRRKRAAVNAFTSQLLGDASTGSGPVLRASTVQRAARPFEVIFL